MDILRSTNANSIEIKLDKTISEIRKIFNDFTIKWNKEAITTNINQKNTQIKDIYNGKEVDKDFQSNLEEYMDFLNKNTMHIYLNLPQAIAQNRIKSLSSIQDKIDRYMCGHVKGKVSINKCLNDIFGMRLYCDSCDIEVLYGIIQGICNRESQLKCIYRNIATYRAIHIYFKFSNFRYQWELQIWHTSDITNNIRSHRKYKQGYTKWEEEIAHD